MKKITIIIILVAMASCKEAAKEMPGDKTRDQMVNEAAMPYIIKEMGELDFNVTIARDKTKDTIFRGIAIDKIRQAGAEYLYSATIENIYSRDFDERLENQKKLIITNRREIERNKQYKQSAIEQFKK
jgi:hypothetical protein